MVAMRGRENRDAALPSAFQPVFFHILGDFCVFGDLRGALMPLPLPDPCVVPLGCQRWLGINPLTQIKQCRRLGI